MRVFLGLGSNLGDRSSHLNEALRRLRAILDDLKAAPFVDTEPLDRNGARDESAPSYMNTVVSGSSDLAPRELFQKLLSIETEMGRDPSEKSLYLPRAIDIDILCLMENGKSVFVNDDDLVVPHPRLKDRPFFLEPLSKWGVNYREITARR